MTRRASQAMLSAHLIAAAYAFAPPLTSSTGRPLAAHGVTMRHWNDEYTSSPARFTFGPESAICVGEGLSIAKGVTRSAARRAEERKRAREAAKKTDAARGMRATSEPRESTFAFTPDSTIGGGLSTLWRKEAVDIPSAAVRETASGHAVAPPAQVERVAEAAACESACEAKAKEAATLAMEARVAEAEEAEAALAVEAAAKALEEAKQAHMAAQYKAARVAAQAKSAATEATLALAEAAGEAKPMAV